MWIGEDVKITFSDKYDIIHALQQMRNDAVMTQYEVLGVLEQM
jgi:hypothetical protein